MKPPLLHILALAALVITGGCISHPSRPTARMDIAPLKLDASPEQLLAWPIIPAIRRQDDEPDNMHEQFGDAEPSVRAFLTACMTDFEKYRQEIINQKDAPPIPDFARHFPNLLRTAAMPTLSSLQKKNLDQLLVIHNLCCRINHVFFLLARPHQSTDDLQNALKTAADFKNMLEASPVMNIPAVTRRAEADGDVLGTEWMTLFDGTTPLSPVPDEWSIDAAQNQSVPCRYGRPFPTASTQNPPQDRQLTISVKTKIPHDGKTPIYLIAQGLPEGFTAELDGSPLSIDAGKSSVRIAIPPQLTTGKLQTLSISWKSNLYDNNHIFRQFWFVMKN